MLEFLVVMRKNTKKCGKFVRSLEKHEKNDAKLQLSCHLNNGMNNSKIPLEVSHVVSRKLGKGNQSFAPQFQFWELARTIQSNFKKNSSVD